MSDIKYKIEVGNCEPGIGKSITRPIVIPNDVTFDITALKFNSTELTFDNL